MFDPDFICKRGGEIKESVNLEMCEKILSNAVPCPMIGNDPAGRVKWIASHRAFLPADLSLGGNVKLQNPKSLKEAHI